MNLESNHLCIDTETLGFCDNSIVLCLAITPFNFMKDVNITFDELLERSFFIKLNAKEQHKKGRSTDKTTLEWWKTQSDEVKQFSYRPSDNDVNVQEALTKLNSFVDSCNYSFKNSYIFERGMGYDTTKLQSLYEMYDVKPSVNFWRAREIRTINDLVADVSNGKYELPEGRPSNFIEHHALHDAALDALRLIRMFDVRD